MRNNYYFSVVRINGTQGKNSWGGGVERQGGGDGVNGKEVGGNHALKTPGH